jgi:uncharacterized protein (DUF1800 family)
MNLRALHATIRFGLGRKPDDVLPEDPAEWLAAQIDSPAPVPTGGATVAEAMAALALDRTDPRPPGEPGRARQIFRAEAQALIGLAVATDTPFYERLVWFWANHFTVSLRRGIIAPLVGAYVRDAIRPYVTGGFGDMLLAVMRHPAMLLYLDNAGSTGPNSIFGLKQQRGLNENLARECLELHTCTPAAGYTQADVTEFARVLTGWSVGRQQEAPGFRFRPALHDPGAKQVLGQSFPEGEQGGIDALAFLAAHPMTHRHLATKLVRHFVADEPPPDAVRTVEGALRDTGGNLGAAAVALVREPATWQPLTKLRTPWDYLLAAVRASGLPPDNRPNMLAIMAGLGQPAFNAPFPIGWPDSAADWAGPEAMLRRIDWAYGFAGRAQLPDAEALADMALGPLLSDATLNEVRRAGSRRDAMTLLLGSPEFQRR